jgi:hypothetical protein
MQAMAKKKASAKSSSRSRAGSTRSSGAKTSSTGRHSKKKKTKLSALSAAAQVLKESRRPMTCAELVAAMARKKYWQSPGGKTPEQTLSAAIRREIQRKGKQSRFRLVERGRFGLR